MQGRHHRRVRSSMHHVVSAITTHGMACVQTHSSLHGIQQNTRQQPLAEGHTPSACSVPLKARVHDPDLVQYAGTATALRPSCRGQSSTCCMALE